MTSWTASPSGSTAGSATAGKPPTRSRSKNEDLRKRLDAAANARHDVTWKWVKGHADDVMNNRADELRAARSLRR
ncbi:MAG: RNase H family protein [Hyphomonadaceae bacterium]